MSEVGLTTTPTGAKGQTNTQSKLASSTSSNLLGIPLPNNPTSTPEGQTNFKATASSSSVNQLPDNILANQNLRSKGQTNFESTVPYSSANQIPANESLKSIGRTYLEPAALTTSHGPANSLLITSDFLPESPSELRSSGKTDIVDVTADAALFNSFLREWAEAKVYSLSLACGPAAMLEQTTADEPESIGYQSSADSISSKGEIICEFILSYIIILIIVMK